MDLTEAEDIKKRWQEYTEELYKKDLHDPDNHDDVITHLSSVQFGSVTESCPTLCHPMNHSTLGLPVHHHLLEFIQTHVH